MQKAHWKNGFLGSSSRWVGGCLSNVAHQLLRVLDHSFLTNILYSQSVSLVMLIRFYDLTPNNSLKVHFVSHIDHAQSGWIQVGMPTDHSIRNGWLENSVYIYIYPRLLFSFLTTLCQHCFFVKILSLWCQNKIQCDSLSQRLFVKFFVRLPLWVAPSKNWKRKTFALHIAQIKIKSACSINLKFKKNHFQRITCLRIKRVSKGRRSSNNWENIVWRTCIKAFANGNGAHPFNVESCAPNTWIHGMALLPDRLLWFGSLRCLWLNTLCISSDV